jgi:hypothetical protein
MSKRGWVVLAVLAAVMVGALAAVFLSGVVILGDPFTGLWNSGGKLTDKGPNGGYLIKHTADGYEVSEVVGKDVLQGPLPLKRDGRKLVGEWGGGVRQTFVYQPWNGHLILSDWVHGHPDVPPVLTLRKATSSTSVPPEAD